MAFIYRGNIEKMYLFNNLFYWLIIRNLLEQSYHLQINIFFITLSATCYQIAANRLINNIIT